MRNFVRGLRDIGTLAGAALAIVLLSIYSGGTVAAPTFSVINSHVPKWTNTTTNTVPPGGSSVCVATVSSTTDPVNNTGTCDQYGRCEGPISYVDTQLGSYYVQAQVFDGCYQKLFDNNYQNYQGFGITTTRETTANDGKGIWYQAWPDTSIGQDSQTPVWLELNVYYEGFLRSWNFDSDPLQVDKGKGTGEFTVEIRHSSSGRTMWAKTFKLENAMMEGNSSFPFNDPPEEAFKTFEQAQWTPRTFKLPTYAGTSFFLYIKHEMGAESQEVRSNDVGAVGRSSALWYVTFEMTPRTE